MEVASTDGVTVAVHDLGGDGEPFLICHATGFCGRAYEPFAAHLVERFHVWALDFRGHGDSTPPDGDRFDWGGMADDLLAVIETIATGPIDVFGHSMGGAAAILVERRVPGTLRSAYFYEPIVMTPVIEIPVGAPEPLSIGARRRKAGFPSRAEAILRYAGRPPLNELKASALAAYVEHGFRDLPDGSVALKCLPAYEGATFDAGGKPTVDMMTGITTPTTIAIGTTDRGWTPAIFGPALAEALPHGRLDRHPTLGHFGPLENPVVIAEAVLATLAS